MTEETRRKVKITLMLLPILAFLILSLVIEVYLLIEMNDIPFAKLDIRNINYQGVFAPIQNVTTPVISGLRIETGHTITQDDITLRREFLFTPTGYTAYDRERRSVYSVTRDWMTDSFPRDFLFSEYEVSHALKSIDQVIPQLDGKIMESLRAAVPLLLLPSIMGLITTSTVMVLIFLVWGFALWKPSTELVESTGFACLALILIRIFIVTPLYYLLRPSPIEPLKRIFMENLAEWGLELSTPYRVGEIVATAAIMWLQLTLAAFTMDVLSDDQKLHKLVRIREDQLDMKKETYDTV